MKADRHCYRPHPNCNLCWPEPAAKQLPRETQETMSHLFQLLTPCNSSTNSPQRSLPRSSGSTQLVLLDGRATRKPRLSLLESCSTGILATQNIEVSLGKILSDSCDQQTNVDCGGDSDPLGGCRLRTARRDALERHDSGLRLHIISSGHRALAISKHQRRDYLRNGESGPGPRIFPEECHRKS